MWSQLAICVLPAFGINNNTLIYYRKKYLSIVNENYDNEYSLIQQWLQSESRQQLHNGIYAALRRAIYIYMSLGLGGGGSKRTLRNELGDVLEGEASVLEFIYGNERRGLRQYGPKFRLCSLLWPRLQLRSSCGGRPFWTGDIFPILKKVGQIHHSFCITSDKINTYAASTSRFTLMTALAGLNLGEPGAFVTSPVTRRGPVSAMKPPFNEIWRNYKTTGRIKCIVLIIAIVEASVVSRWERSPSPILPLAAWRLLLLHPLPPLAILWCL